MQRRGALAVLIVAAVVVCALLAVRMSERSERRDVARVGGGESANESRTIEVGGRQRAYLFHRPAGGEGRALPLLLAFHGGEGTPRWMARTSGFDALADRDAFAVVYPQAIEHWNDGRTSTAGFGPDLDFVSALIDELVAREGIDRARVYATGMSNGGLFTLRLACERATQIAAFAAVAASFPTEYRAGCAPARPVAMLLINGTEDRFIRWEGGDIPRGPRLGVGGTVIPVPETVEFWRVQGACAAPSGSELHDAADDATTAKVTQYAGCIAGAALTFVEIEGGGHTWPGARSELPRLLVGRVSRDVDASELIWNFVRGRSLASDAHEDDAPARARP